jgi:SnoaL-like domain
MAIHATLTPEESVDRLVIRELIDAYAHCADHRDAAGQKALFTPDTHFVVYIDAKLEKPTQDLHGRESLTPAFENLNNC